MRCEWSVRHGCSPSDSRTCVSQLSALTSSVFLRFLIVVDKSRSHSLTAHLKLGIIAGNGRFPFLVLDAARAQGYQVVVAAIKEETSPEIESRGATVHWLSLGELSKLIDTFKAEGVTRAVMAGQVKHKQIFSAIKPDWRLAK